MASKSQTLTETVGTVDSTTSDTVVQIVEASFDSVARARTVNAAIRYAGGSDEGWVQPSSSRLVEDPEGNADTGALNAFNESHNSASLDVDIDSGEALVGGAYLMKDTPTTVTLSASTNSQDVYCGWKDSAEDTVIIGKSGDFSSNDPKHKIWTFDTDSSGVTSATDQRNTDNFRVRNEDGQFTQNLTSDETLNQHPLGSGDIASNSVGSSEADTANIDADEFSGGNGTSGQVLTSDGTNSNWFDLPIYGDGSDGAITRSSNQNENGVIEATTYKVESGNTLTVTNGILIVLAQTSITINGTIDASGQGSAGGSGASGGANSDGGAGTNADLLPDGTGGAGGSDVGGVNDSNNSGDGGDGGDGDTSAFNNSYNYSDILPISISSLIETVTHGNGTVGSGGGGGGGGVVDTDLTTTNGNNGASPGGAGSGGARSGIDSTSNPGGDGGNGGDGGGMVVLVAPSITVGGTINASGTSGSDGTVNNDCGGGGGGGGTGGIIILKTPDLTKNTPTIDVSGGSGGAGGTSSVSADGGDGASGGSGIQKELP